MLGASRRESAVAVRGGRGDAAAEGREQLLRHRVRGHADGDGVLAARHGVVNVGGASHHHGERSRPEALREHHGRVRHFPHPARQEARAVEMHDHRMIARPALRLEDLADRGRVLRVGAQPVDRLRRKSNELAVAQRLHGGLDLDLGSSDHSNHDDADSSKAGRSFPRPNQALHFDDSLGRASTPAAVPRPAGGRPQKLVGRPVMLVELQGDHVRRIVPGDRGQSQ